MVVKRKEGLVNSTVIIDARFDCGELRASSKLPVNNAAASGGSHILHPHMLSCTDSLNCQINCSVHDANMVSMGPASA
jgi:hypothetical protein